MMSSEERSSPALWVKIIGVSFSLSLLVFLIAHLYFYRVVISLELPLLLVIGSSTLMIVSYYYSLRSVYGAAFFLLSLGLASWGVGESLRSYARLFGGEIAYPSPYDSFYVMGDVLFSAVFIYFLLFRKAMVRDAILNNIPVLMLLAMIEGAAFSIIFSSNIFQLTIRKISYLEAAFSTYEVLIDLVLILMYIIIVLAVRSGIIHSVMRTVAFSLVLVVLADYLYSYSRGFGLIPEVTDLIYAWAYSCLLLSSLYLLWIARRGRV